MIQATRKKEKPQKNVVIKKNDIIVTRYTEKTTYENGKKITQRVPKQINITRLVNETKKLIKTENAKLLKNIEEMKNILSK